MLYDDYAECAQRYKELYGEAVLVAYEVGKFYEWYNCDGDRGCDVRGVCELLNLVCTRKSKAIPEISRSNPLMAGVPVSAFPKYVPTLLDAGYTVVVVSQVLVSEGDTPSSRVFDRRVTEVLSKGTYVPSSVTSAEHPHHRPVCMCICLDWHRESTAMPGPVHDRRAASASSPAVVHAGCAYADASTGACACCEVNSTRTDVGAAQDELHRIVADWCPTEVLLVGRRPPGFDVRAFSYHLGIDPEDVRDRLRPKESKKEEGEEEDEESRKTAETTCFSTKHHEHVLRRTYGAHSTGFLSVTEALDLEMHPHARAAFVALLTFLEEHGERCATGMRRPHVRQDDFVEGDDDDDDETTTASSQRRRLTLSYNAARQLDVISFSSRGGSGKASLAKDGTLHGLLDVCVTSQGRRFMREQLMAPLTDAGAVRRRLDAVEFVMEGRRYVEVRNALGRVIDLERLFRRLVVGTGVPRDFESLEDALCATTAATEAVVHSSSSSFSSFVAKLRSDVAVLWESLSDLASSKDDGGGGINNKTGDAAFERNVFRRGVRPDLDALQERADGLHANFIATCRACNRHLPLTGGHAAFRLDVTTAVPSSPSSPAFRQYAITGTTKRCASLLNQLREAGGRTHDGDMVGPATSVFLRPANANASQVWTPAMEAWNAEAIEVDAALRSGAKEAFSAFVKDFVSDHRDRMWRLVTAVAYLDFVAAGAYVADDRRYVRPRVNYAGPSSSSSCGSSSSSFRARGLRHPVVEALNRDVPHVSNDVRLGVFDDGDTVPPVGLLLYGMNAAGKSCLMKAVGLAVVMAQAGLFVAAEELELVPFRRILTRIQSRDDLCRGQSTFMVEMAELRNMLRRCDARSLAIGDEICSGTEAVSALAVVGASVRHLVRARVPFLFATHLHDLTSLLDPEVAERVRVCHLRVHYDPVTQDLVYDRKLCEGQGATVYGLEVCKALDMGADFLDEAHALRRRVLGMPQQAFGAAAKPSRYNARVLVDVCRVCEKRQAEETHHIRPQKEADARGYIQHFHKNAAFNLVPLCGECHDAAHRGDLDIRGYMQTSRGVVLDVTDRRRTNC